MSKAQLRASQLLTTFGPGSMLDLPDGSVIVAGLDQWRYDLSKPLPVVEESRLQAKLRQRLQRPALTLRRPPASDDDPRGKNPGVMVWRFPQWFLVQKAIPVASGTRRQLVHQSRLERGKFRDGSEPYDVVPIRFVRACENGHVDDIEWPVFVHQSPGGCGGDLYLEERSTTGELTDIWVVCSCGKSRSLAQAARKGSRALGACDGSRPWLGAYSREGCTCANRLLIRSASNAYFPQIISVISVPDPRTPVDEVVAALWDAGLGTVETPEQLAFVRKIPNVASRLVGIADAEVMASILRVRQGNEGAALRPVKEVEFEVFAETKDELGADTIGGDFYARNLPRKGWNRPWMKPISRVVLIHRLREVVAQVGFTRFEPQNADINGELPSELNLAVKPAILAREADWLPAIENRGEGVFLLFDPAAIASWLQKPQIAERGRWLNTGFEAWLKDHPQATRVFPGLPYYVLHTFAHLLMTAISLDCGYPASSLRERIYALPDPTGGPGRFGVMILTGSSDAEGTLGGLVAAARKIDVHVRRGLELAMLCSNDPVCAHHEPGRLDRAPLLGAACHGCVLVPETSCEQRNDFLDRALVAPTVENAGCELFTL